jgi:hypothetical protein
MQLFQDDKVEDKDLIWFNCMCEASVVHEQYSLKDIASLFFEGIKPIDSLESVQDMLTSWYEPNESDIEEKINDRYLKCRVCVFYNESYRRFHLVEEIKLLEDELDRLIWDKQKNEPSLD